MQFVDIITLRQLSFRDMDINETRLEVRYLSFHFLSVRPKFSVQALIHKNSYSSAT